MSSVESLREFVNERLTAAAEEIFGVFQKTIVEYEEEIYRQRKLLDIVWKPEIKLHRIDLQQPRVCEEEEEEVLTDQQLCNQESNSSLDQEDPEPLQIKEEQEELCSSQEGEEVVLKVEVDTFLVTPTDEERDHVEPEPESEHQLLLNNFYAAESQDQKGYKHEDSTRDAESEQNNQQYENKSHSNIVYNPNASEFGGNKYKGKYAFKCNDCGREFKHRSLLQRHSRIHTGEKPYVCTTCGKAFTKKGNLKVHIRGAHFRERPYLCKMCGKGFREMSALKMHQRIHTGEKPYVCTTCGKAFTRKGNLKVHRRIHTGEKLYTCTICGKALADNSALKGHIIQVHTNERAYLCNMCGKRFSTLPILKRHQKIHTGEKPYICTTCGRAFTRSCTLKDHIRNVHTGENRQLCTTCGKTLSNISTLKKHQRIHTR